MEIKPLEVIAIGTVFALYDQEGKLIIADRDKAAVEAALQSLLLSLDKPEDETQVAPAATIIVNATDLSDLSVRELKKIARERGVFRHQLMEREDLLAAIAAIDERRLSDA